MGKRRLLPDEARSDFLAVCRFSTEQLQALEELFSSGESVPPYEAAFFEKVAERLHLDTAGTRSALFVAGFLQELEERGFDSDEVVKHLRDTIDASAAPEEKAALLAGFDRHSSIWTALTSPKPARIRQQKIRQLSQATQRTADEFRTICQLRPLFEKSADGHEAISGHVLTVLMEVTLISSKGAKETLVFDLTPEALESLEEVIQRTKQKLQTILDKYGREILNVRAAGQQA